MMRFQGKIGKMHLGRDFSHWDEIFVLWKGDSTVPELEKSAYKTKEKALARNTHAKIFFTTSVGKLKTEPKQHYGLLVQNHESEILHFVYSANTWN